MLETSNRPEQKAGMTYVGDRPSLTLPLRGPASLFTDPALLDFLRKEVEVESATVVTATAVPSNILFRLCTCFNSRVFGCSLSDFRFFAVPCPESRSEALRFVAEAGVEALPFLSVACSFFQLLERLARSIPTVSMSVDAKTL